MIKIIKIMVIMTIVLIINSCTTTQAALAGLGFGWGDAAVASKWVGSKVYKAKIANNKEASQAPQKADPK